MCFVIWQFEMQIYSITRRGFDRISRRTIKVSIEMPLLFKISINIMYICRKYVKTNNELNSNN